MKVSEKLSGAASRASGARNARFAILCRAAIRTFDSISEFIKKVLGKVVVSNDFTYSPRDRIIE